MKSSRNDSKSIETRVADLLARMTLEEKVSQLTSVLGYNLMEDRKTFSPQKAEQLLKHGIGQITRPGGGATLGPREAAGFINDVQRYLIENTRLGIPALLHEECLLGYQMVGATIFPQSIGVASTWNPEIVEEMTKAISREVRSLKIHQVLAPVLDVARDPRWGRLEETYGEDPYLVAAIGAAYVKGIQSDGIGGGLIATLKHLAGYAATEGGLNWTPAHIPERELREIYLFPFEVAIKEAGAMAVMNGYHEIDGVPCACSRYLLNDILRREWGFEGIVVSDYWSIKMLHEDHYVASSREEAGKLALEAGVEVELPERECFTDKFCKLIEEDLVSEEILDNAVSRVLGLKFRLGVFDNPFADGEAAAKVFDMAEHRDLSRKVAQESIVLLKNDGDLLPLDKEIGKIAVIGPNADSWRNLLGDYSYPAIYELRKVLNENMDPAELSELPNPTVPVVTILEGIKAKVSPNTEVLYAKGCGILDKSKDGFNEAVEISAEVDVTVIVLGGKSGYAPDCTSGEERDRADINLLGVQEELLKAVCETGTPVVLVLADGRPLSIKWAAENVQAILEAWLPGEEGGNAVADVLFGDVNPGGRLPISFPIQVGQVPYYYSVKPSAGRKRRWGKYLDAPESCLFPFGHGLSYTTFEYSNLRIEPLEVTAAGKVTVTLDVKNVGDRAGDEVVQLYIRDRVASVTRPVKELKDFKRIALQPGDMKTVTFELSTDLLAFYDSDMNLAVEPGDFEVLVGRSSEDIRLQGELTVVGEKRIIGKSRVFLSNCLI